jgi:hypothetical protein
VQFDDILLGTFDDSGDPRVVADYEAVLNWHDPRRPGAALRGGARRPGRAELLRDPRHLHLRPARLHLVEITLTPLYALAVEPLSSSPPRVTRPEALAVQPAWSEATAECSSITDELVATFTDDLNSAGQVTPPRSTGAMA